VSDMADKIARALFEMGDDQRGNPCKRIEFKLAPVNGVESSCGGLCESAFASFLRRQLQAQVTAVDE